MVMANLPSWWNYPMNETMYPVLPHRRRKNPGSLYQLHTGMADMGAVRDALIRESSSADSAIRRWD